MSEQHEFYHREAHGKSGLVLSGGGARGAYQAGVVRAVAEIAGELKVKKPIPVLTGVSAGAINTAFLAAGSDDWHAATRSMCEMWSRVTVDQVFRTDVISASRMGFKLISDAALGALYRKKQARSLLDTRPLWDFLSKHVPFDRIPGNLAAGHFDALALTAMNYSNSHSITFVEAQADNLLWTRSRRHAETARIGVDHVMASAAIPIFFPPVKVGDYHFGDGCLRNTAPLSPAIHLGADRLMVISVRKPDSLALAAPMGVEPSIARILGVILNALLLDAIDLDMERLSRINQTLDFVPEGQKHALQLRPVDYLWIRPSEDIGQLAGENFHRLPAVIRYLVGGLGSSKEAAELTSYLLFDPVFCGRLVEIGYKDGMANRDEVTKFLLGK